MKFGVDDKPSLGPMLLYGLQWWAVSLPCVVIMGVVVSRLHYTDISLQAFYLQKLFAVTGAATIVQILWGHRMPLVVGPATILLVGMLASMDQGINAIYTAIIVGGAALALAAFSIMGKLRFFFTPRIVSVILVLIAFTLTPTILKLVLGDNDQPAFHLCFAILTVLGLVICNRFLPGVMKSMTVIIGIGGGTIIYFLIQGIPETAAQPAGASTAGLWLIESFDFRPGTVLSFLFCFLALSINELGSIESLGHMLKVDKMTGRIKRGVGVQGLANMVSGSFGVIGSVDYSLSAGVIAGTGNASRFTLIPAGIGLIMCAFSSQVVMVLSHIPGAVMGALMLYLMAAQLASGLTMLVDEKSVTGFESGITVGLSLMVGLMVAFVPGPMFNGLPEVLRPIVGNGFVMGTITVILLEHVVFRKKAGKAN